VSQRCEIAASDHRIKAKLNARVFIGAFSTAWPDAFAARVSAPSRRASVRRKLFFASR
jgi:hypothetical protein